MITFDEHYRRVVAEAEAEGPAAVAELRMYETSYRLAGQLITRRRELRMTQQQLAAASGIHQSEISRIESGNGNPTLKTLGALTSALGVQLSIAAK
jgi:DNA-binding XRE family transcriptional regulator